MPAIEVDLYSDTLTKPTAAMRAFMCAAEVGDEQKGEDPTVNLLCEMVADLLDKKAAVFFPSGTTGNEIALKVHTRPGEEVLIDRTAHPLHYGAGAPVGAALLERGARMGAMGPSLVRAVTHLDVDRAGIERALTAARSLSS